MRILLLGRNGQIGWELSRSLSPLGDLVALGRKPEGGLCGDLGQLEDLANTVQSVKPDVIVNAAAYTNVDMAEDEPDKASRINCEALGVLAEEAKSISAWLIHYSSDYVFDGNSENPWKETDATKPVNTYGKTKLDGEMTIRNSHCRYLIFRTSWVYAARGRNFVSTMLRLANERESLSVVNDQFGSPTGAELIADVTAQILARFEHESIVPGIYHLAAAGDTTWFKYSRFIINTARSSGWKVIIDNDAILPVLSQEYSTPATRPQNSRLDCTKLEMRFNLKMPEWSVGVRRCIQEIIAREIK